MEDLNFTHSDHRQYAELVDEKIKRLQDEDGRLSKRITECEKIQVELQNQSKALNEMNTSIKLMLVEQKDLREGQKDLTTRIKKQEEKDAQKWSKMWGYLIPAILSFIAGYATNFIK